MIRLKNTMLSRKHSFSVQKTVFIKSVAEALKKLGYLSEVSENKGILEIKLAYKSKEPTLTDIKIISKPSLRVYKSAKELSLLRGPSLYLVSTPNGVISSKEAVKKNIGGEVIAEVI